MKWTFRMMRDKFLYGTLDLPSVCRTQNWVTWTRKLSHRNILKFMKWTFPEMFYLLLALWGFFEVLWGSKMTLLKWGQKAVKRFFFNSVGPKISDHYQSSTIVKNKLEKVIEKTWKIFVVLSDSTLAPG